MRVVQKTLEIFCSHNKEPFSEWLASIKDERAAAKIKARLARVRLGNIGNSRSVGQGVRELKIDYGPGYRVYFGQVGDELIILLCGGDKRGQNDDIKKAKEYWSSYKKRQSHADY